MIFNTYLLMRELMRNYLILIQIILFPLANPLLSQETKVSENDSTYIGCFNNKLYLEGGINISNFQNFDSEAKTGFSFGFTFDHFFTDRFGYTISALIEKENAYLNRIESIYNDNNICYREYYDIDASFLFLEIPISLYYKFWEDESFSAFFSLGYGVSLLHKDNSERTNYLTTDEVIIPSPCDYLDTGDYYHGDENIFENSGGAINAAIWLKYKYFIFKLIYINKTYAMKELDNLQTLSVHLGYLIHHFSKQ